jgi:hypothetical protein
VTRATLKAEEWGRMGLRRERPSTTDGRHVALTEQEDGPEWETRGLRSAATRGHRRPKELVQEGPRGTRREQHVGQGCVHPGADRASPNSMEARARRSSTAARPSPRGRAARRRSRAHRMQSRTPRARIEAGLPECEHRRAEANDHFKEEAGGRGKPKSRRRRQI